MLDAQQQQTPFSLMQVQQADRFQTMHDMQTVQQQCHAL